MVRRYVAIDVRLSPSVVVAENEAGEKAGEKVGVACIDNDLFALAEALRDAGEAPEVAIEATCGWYWAVDVLQELGANVFLVNPSGLAWENRRVKGDYRDCCDLLDRVRLGKLPEAWIAPHATERAERAGPGPAGHATHRAESPAQGGAGQARAAPAGERPVGGGRPGLAGPARSSPGVYHSRRVHPRSGGGLRPRDRHARPGDPP